MYVLEQGYFGPFRLCPYCTQVTFLWAGESAVMHTKPDFIGLAYQEGKDIVVFRFIIEYSSLRDFGP